MESGPGPPPDGAKRHPRNYRNRNRRNYDNQENYQPNAGNNRSYYNRGSGGQPRGGGNNRGPVSGQMGLNPNAAPFFYPSENIS